MKGIEETKKIEDTIAELWLLDVSTSMSGTRIRKLCQAVHAFHQTTPHVHLVAFSTDLQPLKSIKDLDNIIPWGGTNLHLGLEYAAEKMAGRVIVFTDGEPNDEEECFRVANFVPGIISCVFCGDDSDNKAKRFCEKLSRDNGGEFVSRDIAKGYSLLDSQVREVLGLPAPIAL